MIGSHSVLAVIPARGGSKRVPGKNLRLCGGKPLIEWTIEAAKQAACFDAIIVSSDDAAILDFAERDPECGTRLRPAELATDEAKPIDAVLDVLNFYGDYDYVVLLQPTSPLRTAADIASTLTLCQERGAHSCVSLSASSTKNPEWMYAMDCAAKIVPIIATAPTDLERKKMPVYGLNGAVYVAKTELLKRKRLFVVEGTLGYPMPRERSIDIDDEYDLIVADHLLRTRNGVCA